VEISKRITMANPEIDIGRLSESQRLVLEQYIAMTNQEVEAAVPLLQRSQWNVQVRLGTLSLPIMDVRILNLR
jgi:UBA-like domain